MSTRQILKVGCLDRNCLEQSSQFEISCHVLSDGRRTSNLDLAESCAVQWLRSKQNMWPGTLYWLLTDREAHMLMSPSLTDISSQFQHPFWSLMRIDQHTAVAGKMHEHASLPSCARNRTGRQGHSVVSCLPLNWPHTHSVDKILKTKAYCNPVGHTLAAIALLVLLLDLPPHIFLAAGEW